MEPVAHGVSEWLQGLAETRRLSKKTETVVRSLASHPRLASYGSVREVAEKADVSVSTITRTAQALGFSGWPAFQEELRAIYISSLTTVEITEHRKHGQERPSYAWLSRDRDNLNSFIKAVDLDRLSNVARAIARSRRTFVTGLGSYQGIALILAHSASLYGHDVRLLGDSQTANTIAHLRSDDLVIAINFWRIYRSTAAVVEACQEKGVPVILIGENLTREVEEQCLETIKVPSEAIGFSPSLTVVLSAVHAIVAELQELDPGHSARAVQLAEREWLRFGVIDPR